MQTQTTSPSKSFRLRFRSEEKIVVESDDEHLFKLAEKAVASTFRFSDGTRNVNEEFHEFLNAVHQWSKDQSDQLEETCLAVRGGHIELLFVTKMDDYDWEFNQKMIDFDTEQVVRYDWLRTQVMQIPRPDKSCLTSFNNLAIVYANGN